MNTEVKTKPTLPYPPFAYSEKGDEHAHQTWLATLQAAKSMQIHEAVELLAAYQKSIAIIEEAAKRRKQEYQLWIPALTQVIIDYLQDEHNGKTATVGIHTVASRTTQTYKLDKSKINELAELIISEGAVPSLMSNGKDKLQKFIAAYKQKTGQYPVGVLPGAPKTFLTIK